MDRVPTGIDTTIYEPPLEPVTDVTQWLVELMRRDREHADWRYACGTAATPEAVGDLHAAYHAIAGCDGYVRVTTQHPHLSLLAVIG